MDFDRLPIDNLSFPIHETEETCTIFPETLSAFAAAAFDRLSFTFTHEHLEHFVSITRSTENSENDRRVASILLENAVIAAKGTYPLCQDTGIAQIFAWKDAAVCSGDEDEAWLSAGIEETYRKRNLRFSTTIPSSLFSEDDPQNNMPAQIMITATQSRSKPAYRFLFCAKGGGSSNKTSLVQATKALLEEKVFTDFLSRHIANLGTAACPPYTIAVIVGGLSPEQNILALKLATTGYFDQELPGWDYRVFGTKPLRDTEWEQKVMQIAAETGLGAQFGGKALAIAARVLRLPRHGASCPVSIGVSCAAHRNLHGYIDGTGVYLEHTENDPLAVPFLQEAVGCSQELAGKPLTLDLNAGIPALQAILSGIKPGTALLLSGDIIVARDAAHARWRSLLAQNERLPNYLEKHAIFYAGPARTPEGSITGSIGPTTAGRMDEYAEELMSRGAALITLAKGNRSETWRSACKTWGGTYLGTVGGAAALAAERNITASSIIDYTELGMEAVRLVTLKDLPAFVLINDRGQDFFNQTRENGTCR